MRLSIFSSARVICRSASDILRSASGFCALNSASLLVFRFGLVDVPLALDKLRDAVCDLLAGLRHRFAELVLFFGYLFGCLCEIVRIAPIRLRALVEPRYGVLVLLQSRIVGVQLSVVFDAGFVVLVDRHVVFAAYLFVDFAGDAGLFPFAERRADFVEHGLLVSSCSRAASSCVLPFASWFHESESWFCP